MSWKPNVQFENKESDRELTDQDIDAVAAKIVAEVTKKTGGVLRG